MKYAMYMLWWKVTCIKGLNQKRRKWLKWRLGFASSMSIEYAHCLLCLFCGFVVIYKTLRDMGKNYWLVAITQTCKPGTLCWEYIIKQLSSVCIWQHTIHKLWDYFFTMLFQVLYISSSLITIFLIELTWIQFWILFFKLHINYVLLE